MLLDIIPILSIVLIVFATFLTLSRRKKEKDLFSFILIILNVALLITIITFYINYLINSSFISNMPIWFYWLLIILGLVIEVMCLYKKYVAGQILAGAIHLFVVFPTIFSIGIILLLLAVIELIVAIINVIKEKRNLKLLK